MSEQLGRDLRLMFFSLMTWGFGVSLYYFIQPLYVAFLGAKPEQIGLALGVGYAAGMVMAVPMASYADRVGRKQVMVVGWTLGAVATVGMAIAPDWRWLIPAMAVRMAAAATMPAFNGYVASLSAGGNPNAIFSRMSMGPTIGSILGPAAGGWIGEAFGMRALYWTAAFFFLVSTLLILGVENQPSLAQKERVRPLGLLAYRPLLFLMLYAFLIFFAAHLGQVMVPNFLQEVRGYTLAEIGRFGTVASVGMTFLLLGLGRFAPHRRAPLLLAQGLVIASLLLWLQSAAPLFIAVAYLIHGRGQLARPFVDGRLSLMLHDSALNVGYGLRQVATGLGVSAAPLVAGLLYAQRPELPLMAGVAALTLTLALTLLLPTHIERMALRTA